MSTESENLYTKNDQLIAQIYDNLSGENKSEEAISLLLNPNHISPTEQVKILGLLGEKDERFHSLLIKTVLNNINILDNNESFKIINNHFIQLVNQAYLLNDNAIMKICQDLFYLISQGVAAFYPYIWILLKNHGHITTYTDKKLRTINHYAVVFSFDGYNAKSIREILKSNCILCSEQALSAFKTVKTKKEQAYSQCAKALLYIMIQAFKKQQPDYDKFDEYLSDVPNKYREELRCDSLSRNSERLYANLYSFFESGDHKQVYGLKLLKPICNCPCFIYVLFS